MYVKGSDLGMVESRITDSSLYSLLQVDEC